MGLDNRMTVATSIPPKMSRLDAGREIGGEYQRLCIRSWLDCGFRVISVNPRDEVAELARRHPEIAFVGVDRDASALAGRKTPFIADLLRALLETPETKLGIVNADVMFEPSGAWQEQVPGLLANTVLGAHRFDIGTLAGTAPRKYIGGFDCFLFDRFTAEALLPRSGSFAMGLPAWDAWLPTAAAILGLEFRVLERPSIAHLAHSQGYADATLRQFSIAFAQFVIGENEKCPERIRSKLSVLLPGCQALLQRPMSGSVHADQAGKAFDKSMALWHGVVSQHAVRLDAPSPSPGLDGEHEQFAASAVFHRFDDQIRADDALKEAASLEQDGNFDEARRVLMTALDRSPCNFDILLGFGEYQYRRGDAVHALALLERAAKQQPRSARAINSMGVVLAALGRREEAIVCFQRIVQAGADFRDAYCSLAVLLHAGRRADEAVECLDAAILRWPEDEELRQMRRHFARPGVAIQPRPAGFNPPNPRGTR